MRINLPSLWRPAGDAFPRTPGEGPSGVERPEQLPPSDGPQFVHRTFAFVDLCGFTEFVERRGAREAIRVLSEFRQNTREITGRRGVRAAKWLGDGVMLVGVDTGPMVATVVELVARHAGTELGLHAGIASGSVLLFEGDDYIGQSVNLAARLSDLAGKDEVLADGDTSSLAPAWVDVGMSRTRHIGGIGRVEGITELTLADGVRLPGPHTRDLIAAS
jgi:class 3 adenylate cyclase